MDSISKLVSLADEIVQSVKCLLQKKKRKEKKKKERKENLIQSFHPHLKKEKEKKKKAGTHL